jgi:glucose-1-phosphate cytidylyltransferase
MRLREHSGVTPKPLVTIGTRPILWHLMRYYAHFGHREFILCLGYRGEMIERYFVDHDAGDWKITFVPTGLETNVGQRLKAVAGYLHHDQMFLANYADALTDLALPGYLREFQQHRTVAGFVSVRPRQTFHVISSDPGGRVDGICSMADLDLWMNGGFFAFRREIFDYLGEGEDLVEEPFHRLIAQGQLMTHRHPGFWACMDTFKDKQLFDEMAARADAPWEVWRRPAAEAAKGDARRYSVP